MSHMRLMTSVCMFVSTLAPTQTQAQSQPSPQLAVRMPTIPNVGGIAGNPWLQTGIEAMANVSANYSVAVPANDLETLPARINEVHQGMTMAGWRFVSEEAVQQKGTTLLVLLTYRRSGQ